MFRPCWSGWRTARQAHRKDRTFARLARHGHVAAHHARELAGDGKAEPRAPETLCSRGIGLGELLEQFGRLFGGESDASIRNRKRSRRRSRNRAGSTAAMLALKSVGAGDLERIRRYAAELVALAVP